MVVCAFLVGNQVKLNLMRSRKSRKGTAGEFPSTILLLWLIRPNPKFCLGFFFDYEHIFVKSEEVFLEISKYFSLVMALLRYFDEKKIYRNIVPIWYYQRSTGIFFQLLSNIFQI